MERFRISKAGQLGPLARRLLARRARSANPGQSLPVGNLSPVLSLSKAVVCVTEERRCEVEKKVEFGVEVIFVDRHSRAPAGSRWPVLCAPRSEFRRLGKF